ncbi:MAG: hypothetical protein KF795_17570 [Labilithrix sp.]|nr:hypothetical protein [Labilithrix sp.]
MAVSSALGAALLALAATGCAPESSADDVRRGREDEGAEDAGLTEAGVDRNGGRDTSAASCFAACQNTAFTCQAKNGSRTTVSEAELTLDATGCTGSLKQGTAAAVALRLDCAEAQVCIGGAPGTTPSDCVDATFSAFTYGYTPSGGVLTVCTRN